MAVSASAVHRPQTPVMPDLVCTLRTSQAMYKIGQVPDLQVRIKNNSNKEIVLIGSLDGSEEKTRMPWCYFTIQKPIPDTVPFWVCGTLNPLRAEDFVTVRPGELFNPYRQIDEYGFFGAWEIAEQETFKNPGIYTIQFHYSTKSANIDDFIGNSYWHTKADSAQQKELFTRVPKVDLESNTIEIRIVE